MLNSSSPPMSIPSMTSITGMDSGREYSNRKEYFQSIFLLFKIIQTKSEFEWIWLDQTNIFQIQFWFLSGSTCNCNLSMSPSMMYPSYTMDHATSISLTTSSPGQLSADSSTVPQTTLPPVQVFKKNNYSFYQPLSNIFQTLEVCIDSFYNLSFSFHFRGQVTAIRVVTLQMLKCHLFQLTFLQQFQPQWTETVSTHAQAHLLDLQQILWIPAIRASTLIQENASFIWFSTVMFARLNIFLNFT